MSLNQITADPEAAPFLPSIGGASAKFGGFRTNFQSRKSLLQNETPKILIKQKSNSKPIEIIKVESSLRRSQARDAQVFSQRQKI